MLSACEDPSGVGLSVIDFGETDPSTRTIAAEAAMGPLVDATGFLRPLAGAFDQRFIVGRAQDPIFGTVTATGYIDFGRPAGLAPGFFTVAIEEAYLEFRPDYRFGDTTREVVIDLYEIQDSWNPQTFRSDTTLAAQPGLVATFSATAADTLVRVQLPDAWVTQRDTLLRSQQFDTLWHGFQLRPRDESGIALGFTGHSRLNVVSNFREETARDTVAFFASGLATGTTVDYSLANVPLRLLPLQDNTGLGLIMTFRLDTLDTRAISASAIRIEADTLLLEANRPAGFERPMARTLVIYGLGDGPPTALAEGLLIEDDEAYVFTSSFLHRVIQDMVFKRSPFDRFGVGFARSPSTLNVAPLVDEPGAPPRVILLVAPHDR
jgi:hypothetical protein